MARRDFCPPLAELQITTDVWFRSGLQSDNIQITQWAKFATAKIVKSADLAEPNKSCTARIYYKTAMNYTFC